jgi:hypothetical protein
MVEVVQSLLELVFLSLVFLPVFLQGFQVTQEWELVKEWMWELEWG